MESRKRSITVSQLNRFVAALLAGQEPLRNLLVQGELSNVKRYASGHWYFNLKDANAQVSCVMFRQQADALRFKPQDGQAVLIGCRASLYERDGKFQLYVDTMQPLGKGDLHLAFEQLNDKLRAEGLYDVAHKRPLPRFPRRIGIATSQSGAVIRDIINVSKRRYPSCRLLLAPCQVQGEGAAASIAAAIRRLNDIPDIDLIIVGRGGGSLEDLWAFNEESLARVVYASAKPIISAVGHETDFTICDFVADLRAPTPSAAAELALPDRVQLLRELESQGVRLGSLLERRLVTAKHRLQRLAANRYLENPYERIAERRLYLDRLSENLERGFRRYNDKQSNNLSRLAARLDALSPLKVLGRGYAMVTDVRNDRPLISVAQIAPKQKLRLHMQDGVVYCRVEEKEERSHGTT